jgi:predicted nucleotide-binding protein
MNFSIEFDLEDTKTKLTSLLSDADQFHQSDSKISFRDWHRRVVFFLKENFSSNEVAKHFEKEADLQSSLIWYENMPEEDEISSYDLASARKALRLYLKQLSGTTEGEAKVASLQTSISTRVFIVHGHDEKRLLEVKEILKSQNLLPVVLKDEPNGGATVIEKFEKNADVGFAVILFTADDIGSAKSASGNHQPRARQNVILELGYFIGRLTRARVCALNDSGVELPSDIHGIVYTLLDDGGAWRYKLLDELKHAGYNVDKNKL